MLNLKNTKTERNLQTALQGEALAHLKYQFYKSKISNYSKEYETLLDEIVHNEKEHGKIWFKQLNEGDVPDDLENLLDAYEGEKLEHLEMYPYFSNIAKEEGFNEIAKLFEEIGKIEGYHMQKFKKLRNSLKQETNFKNEEETIWKCLNCGYQYTGNIAIDICPICNHPKKHFTKQL